MINLIPNTEKKSMRKRFYLRLLVVFFVNTAGAFLVGIIALIPAYIAAQLKISNFDSRLNIQAKINLPESYKDNRAFVEELNSKMDLIRPFSEGGVVVSEIVIDEVLKRKPSSIKITGLSYEKGFEVGEKKINVYGIAPNRDALNFFRQELVKSPRFTSVDLPISNFVKSSNITFFISITPVME